MKLSESVVMITGGALRVGRQLALYMAQQGAQIFFTYLPGEPAEEAHAAISACGVDVMAAQMDVRDTAQIRAAVAGALDHFGRIDVLDQQRLGLA